MNDELKKWFAAIRALPDPPTTPEDALRRERWCEPSRALVVFAHGEGMALVVEPGNVLDVLSENGNGATTEGFSLHAESIDHEALADGVYIGKLKLVNAGAGDWPGTCEFGVTFDKARLATKEEWLEHLSGDFPWDNPRREEDRA
jgi:hypothetical protein